MSNNVASIDGSVAFTSDQSDQYAMAITSLYGPPDDQWMRDFADWLKDHLPVGVVMNGNIIQTDISTIVGNIITPNP